MDHERPYEAMDDPCQLYEECKKIWSKISDILHVVKDITWLREMKMKFHRVLMSVIK